MRFFTWILVLFLWSDPSHAKSDPFLKKLFSEGLSSVQKSIHVVRLKDGRTLFEHMPDRLLTPASVSKLVTAAAALDVLTPAHTFETKLFATGPVKNGSLKGDLVVVGDGDPFLVSEKVWQLAVDLRNLGIKRIEGNLIVDDRLFDEVVRDDSRLGGKSSSRRAYDAPVSAFGINFNTFAVMVVPGVGIGSPAKAMIDPYQLDRVELVGQATTVRGTGNSGVKLRRQVDRKTGLETLTIAGSIGVDAEPAKIYRSVGDHHTAAGDYLRAFLQAQGISIVGKTTVDALPPNAKQIYVLEGYPMQKVIAGLNKYSNNYIADVLVKRMGAKFPSDGRTPDAPRSGTYRNGILVIERFLNQKVRLNSPFTLKNGSGLSTENRLSARQITKLLAYMETRMDLFPEFLASLPSAGRDGTLKERFDIQATQPAIGKIRAKTGTLTQPVAVSSLAGYLRHPAHGWIAFAIIENGKPRSSQPSVLDLRARQDRAIAHMLKVP